MQFGVDKKYQYPSPAIAHRRRVGDTTCMSTIHSVGWMDMDLQEEAEEHKK